MPTINQLPTATAVSAGDQLPLSQNGLTRSVSVSTLLSGTQPAISLGQNSLVGRSSPGLGGPEALKLGSGLALTGNAIGANGQDHLNLTEASALQASDELVINSFGVAKRVGASTVRGLFSAGSGIAIDSSGVISNTGNGSGAAASGPQGPAGPAGQGFTFRGAWQQSTSYSPYDVVTFGGQTFVAASAISAASSFDVTKWALLAAQGAPGVAGPQGQQGAQGQSGPIVPATVTSLGAVKPGAGLSITSDGSLSIGSVALSTLAQGNAAIGQFLGWTGTGWGPTSGGSSGVASVNGKIGAVTLSVSDITNAIGSGTAARSNLGLAAVASSGAYADLAGAPAVPAISSTAPLPNGVGAPGTSSAVSRSDHIHPSDTSRLATANNLSDVSSVATTRANLGLGSAATLNVGTTAGTVAAGNDARLAGALQASAIPSASGQLLGGSGTAGAASPVSLGTGLALSNGMLTATGGGGYTLPVATASSLGGVKVDGSTIGAASDGTLSVSTISVTSLTDIATLGGPALSDIDTVNRAGNDYRTTLSARTALMRRTPAGSRTVVLTSGASSLTLTAADHDKIVVATGSVAGTLSADGTITDGFRCQIINHSTSALTYSGISGLQGSTSLAAAASCWVALSNSTLEATAAAGVSASGVSSFNSRTGAISLGLADITALTGTGGSARSSLGLAAVAASGAYTDLSGVPTIPVASGSIPLSNGAGNVGTSIAFARADHVHPTDSSRLSSASNLSDLASPATARINLGLGGAATLSIGTGANTVAAGNDSRISGALQAGAIPSASGQILGGSGTAGVAASIQVGAGLSLSGGTLSATASVPLIPAYFTAGVAGVVSQLPGGAGAVVFRYVFVRPCSLATNLATPYGPQSQAATPPMSAAAFGLSKQPASGSAVSIGSVTVSASGSATASTSAVSFAAGDELIITAPSPADAQLADVSISFTGTWG